MRRALLCLLVLAACGDSPTQPEPEIANPITGKAYRAKPAVRVLQWSFTDSSYTIVTTVDGEVIGTSHGWYELFMNLNESPPAWTGMRGGFEHGSYLREGAWIDNSNGLPFRVSFQLGHGNIEIDGDIYYEVRTMEDAE